MANLLAPVARQRVLSDLGAVVPGAQLFTYVSGTPNTPQVTYFDAAGTIPNANPLVASAGGLFGPIYLPPNVAYHFALYDNLGRLLWDQDPVTVADGSNVAGNLTVGGLLTVLGFGGHTIVAGGAGINSLTVRNTQAGGANSGEVAVGNDAQPRLLVLGALSTTFATFGPYVAGAGLLLSQSPVGLHLIASDAAAIIGLFTNNLERMRILPTGDVLIGATSYAPGAVRLAIVSDATALQPVAVMNTSTGGTGTLVQFTNYGGGQAGAIVMTSLTGVTYGTASDARLKDDHGPAADLSALRGLRVHDFAWKADGTRDRGIFAQEAAALYPRAVIAGRDETTADGFLARPWLTDYSRFVADLIVGWQQHDDAIRALEGRAR